jgi:ABC-type bacteriocin/lantibiotic exporter with double-glycine peptidase domain
MHYVIIRKNKEAITIYDSAVGQYNVSYSAFKSSFTNIVIQVSKSNIKVKLNNLNHFNLFKHVDLGYLCMNLLLQVLIIALSTIGANYLNIIINHAILTESGSNTIVISIVFLFIYCSNGLSQYILRLYIAKAFKFNYQYLSQKLLMCLKRKHHNFFDKVDRNYFYLIDNAMQTIVMYAINEVPMLCSNILLSIVTLIVIASISP